MNEQWIVAGVCREGACDLQAMLANLVGLARAVPGGWIGLASGNPFVAGAVPFEGTAEKAARLRAAFAEHSLPIDAAVMPRARFGHKRLLISDMDSTIIGQECIDELADAVGLKPQISEITERAMRGELDFEAALTSRVAMLRGLSLNELDPHLARAHHAERRRPYAHRHDEGTRRRHAARLRRLYLLHLARCEDGWLPCRSRQHAAR